MFYGMIQKCEQGWRGGKNTITDYVKTQTMQRFRQKETSKLVETPILQSFDDSCLTNNNGLCYLVYTG